MHFRKTCNLELPLYTLIIRIHTINVGCLDVQDYRTDSIASMKETLCSWEVLLIMVVVKFNC